MIVAARPTPRMIIPQYLRGATAPPAPAPLTSNAFPTLKQPDTLANQSILGSLQSHDIQRNPAPRRLELCAPPLYSGDVKSTCPSSHSSAPLISQLSVSVSPSGTLTRGSPPSQEFSHSLACACARPWVFSSTASQPTNASPGRPWTMWCRSAICVKCVRRRMFVPHAVASMVAA